MWHIIAVEYYWAAIAAQICLVLSSYFPIRNCIRGGTCVWMGVSGIVNLFAVNFIAMKIAENLPEHSERVSLAMIIGVTAIYLSLALIIIAIIFALLRGISARAP